MLSKALEQFLTDVKWGDLDYLIIDLPPGTGDIQMALSRLLPQAELIVVTTPQLMAQKVATRVADMAKRSFIPLLGKVPISENTNNVADSGTPLIDQNNSNTKVEIEKLINNIAIQLPPIIDETCTGRLAKVFEELSNQ